MDIENMHPFCLPFGFCHDATSSDLVAISKDTDTNQESSDKNTNPGEVDKKEKPLRSMTSSPLDEFCRHLNSTTSSTTSHSLLQDDLIHLGSPSSLDVHGDVDSFYSLELDINIDSDSPNDNNILGTDFIDEFDDLKSVQDDSWFCNQYSLFSPSSTSSHRTLRRIPLIHTTLSSGTNSINASLNNQVFQHVVDPIDIKSSPTLAQLNLNSTDDMTDGIWDSAANTSTSNQQDLLSNCTSISIHHSSPGNHHHLHHHHHSNSASSTGNDCAATTCNHFHQNYLVQQQHQNNVHHEHQQPLQQNQFQHHSGLQSNNHTLNRQHQNRQLDHLTNANQTQQNHHEQWSYQITHLTNVPSVPSCQQHTAQQQLHQHLPYHQQHPDQACSASNGSVCEDNLGHVVMDCNEPQSDQVLQSSCFRASTFRKPDSHQNYLPHCHNFLATTSFSSDVGHNLKSSSTLNQLNQSNPPQSAIIAPASDSPKQFAANNNNDDGDKPNQKLNFQRPISPALVTSSSSPLSSSFQQQQGIDSSRTSDNKLKENIEYLTALLCNGNKLEDNNLQSSISSTMVKSYATLAHSLSTGPKLLERSNQLPYGINNHQHHQLQHQQKQPKIINQTILQTSNPNNEASPCVQEMGHLVDSNMNGHVKRPYSDVWFKVAVESSISAADSTESQVNSLNTGDLHQCSVIQQQQVVANNNVLTMTQQPPQCSSELEVLSSLLHENQSCNNQQQQSIIQSISTGQQSMITCWPAEQFVSQTIQVTTIEKSSLSSQQQSRISANEPSICQNQKSSIPLNGKPITLTPISNNNVIVNKPCIQRTRVSLFAQPSSPSASSTASSGNNSDVTMSNGMASSIAPIPTAAISGNLVKKPRSNTTSSLGSIKQKDNINRSIRPSSFTECSLSSHDEGFSSQIDNEDCGSNRDSDDEDDVDSDDESFYGDYTNSDLIGASISDDAENKWTLNMGRTRRNGQKRYFWQYNVQSKGPKGVRMCPTDDSEDPFVLSEASDPVFSNDCQVEGVKHSGKARRGDGNDLTPNPRKLLMIGLELKKLGKIINELAPVTDLPINARNKTRKEKNKLASRACRLKKKAQHEANKIKLYGLQREHQQVVVAIYDVRKLLSASLQEWDNKNSNSREQIEKQHESSDNQMKLSRDDDSKSSVKSIVEQCSMIVAGQTSDYVNSVLEKVVSGCIDGGLQT